MNRVGMVAGLGLAFLLGGPSIFSQDTLETGNKLQFYSDFRFRAEHDWNSQRANGVFRPDRFRLRYRARFGFNFQWSNQIEFGARLRTGSLLNQQSPHITLGDEFQEGAIGIDKAFIRGAHDKMWWWLGKNTFPFWKQNELLWDDDINPGGVALGWCLPAADQFSLKPSIGYFIIRDTTIDKSYLIAAQIAAEVELAKMKLSFASGFFGFNNMRYRPGQQSWTLDYDIIHSGVKMEFESYTGVTLGFDYLLNLKNYGSIHDIPERLRNQIDGFVGSLSLGGLDKKGDFMVAYTNAQIGNFSVVDYLAQDDWVRWGFANTPGTRSSNFKGHEVKTAYAFGNTFNAVFRIYFVQGMVPADEQSIRETGNRFRMDLNVKF